MQFQPLHSRTKVKPHQTWTEVVEARIAKMKLEEKHDLDDWEAAGKSDIAKGKGNTINAPSGQGGGDIRQGDFGKGKPYPATITPAFVQPEESWKCNKCNQITMYTSAKSCTRCGHLKGYTPIEQEYPPVDLDNFLCKWTFTNPKDADVESVSEIYKVRMTGPKELADFVDTEHIAFAKQIAQDIQGSVEERILAMNANDNMSRQEITGMIYLFRESALKTTSEAYMKSLRAKELRLQQARAEIEAKLDLEAKQRKDENDKQTAELIALQRAAAEVLNAEQKAREDEATALRETAVQTPIEKEPSASSGRILMQWIILRWFLRPMQWNSNWAMTQLCKL